MMEAVDGKTRKGSGGVEERSVEHSNAKIALVPFVEADPPVFLTDTSGKTFPARARSAGDDFRLAVESLGIGHADGGVNGGRADDDNPSKGGTGKEGQERAKQPDAEGKDRCGNGFPGNHGSTKQKKVKEQSKKLSLIQPGEHLLQKAITSFDMALGELNQLLHLIDLARVGEFVMVDRVTPSEEDQAQAFLDKAARPGDGVPPEALPTMVHLKRVQMKGAADQLRQRAKRLRETSKVQTAFQQGVVHLRKSWRIVAPNHGKVNMPLQVGEVLSVDCSFGSAGGRSVPSTAAAGTRHIHPWLFHLKCGESGRLEIEPRKGQCLKAFEVQLMSATTGACKRSFRSRFPGRHSRCNGASEFPGGSPPAFYQGDTSENAGTASIMQLEQHISRIHHSVFLEEVFETIKAEALIDGRDGWIARQDARAETDSEDRGRPTNESKARVQEGKTKRRLVSGCPRDIPSQATGAAGTRVVHVMDDEVVVEMDNHHLLGYRLVLDEARMLDTGSLTRGFTDPQADTLTAASDTCGAKASKLSSLCRLALLYCASVVRQQQRSEGKDTLSKTNRGKGLQPPVIMKTESEGIVSKTTEGGTWKSVLRVLAHHVLRAQVLRKVAGVSRSLHELGLPFAVRWTHLESTCGTSVLTFTLGHRFHFRASLDGGCEITVSALPGLHNHADQRILGLRSADDLQQFLLGEGCRQIVLTFGDIAAAWTGDRCFRVDLVPPTISLWREEFGEPTSLADNLDHGDGVTRSRCEVRVCPQEVGVQIMCSRWSGAWDVSRKTQAGKRNAEPDGWDPDLLNPPRLTTAEWDSLEGRDIFVKFSSLLNYLYPSKDQCL